MRDNRVELLLTVHPEWGFAFCHLGKRCENRTWRPRADLLGNRVAIIAGSRWGGREGRPSRRAGWNAVIDTALAAGWIAGWTAGRSVTGDPYLSSADGSVSIDFYSHFYEDRHGARMSWAEPAILPPKGAVVCVGTLASVDRAPQTEWDIAGQWHWRFEDVCVLKEPVPAKGSLGLRPIPDDPARMVMEQLP